MRKLWLVFLPIIYVIVANQLFKGRYQIIDLVINSILIFLLTLWMIRNLKHLRISELVLSSFLFIYLMVVHHLVTYLHVSQLLHVNLSNLTLNKNMINLKPLKTIHLTFRLEHIPPVMMRQIYGNVFLLTPLGYLLLRLKTLRAPLVALLFTCLFSVSIEVIQLVESYFRIAGRSTDIDDVILNTIGGLLGVAIFMIMDVILARSKHRYKSRSYY